MLLHPVAFRKVLFLFSFPSVLHFYVYSFLFVISECAHQTFTYDGNCYNTCPERTFIVPEQISAGDAESKGLSLKKRDASFDELQDIIGKTESLVKNRAVMPSSVQKLCQSCHESCVRCNGPLETDCVACDFNYNQVISGSKLRCIYKSNETTWTLLDSLKQELNSYSPLKIIFISFVIIGSLGLMCVSMVLLCRKNDGDGSPLQERDKGFVGKYSYNPIVQDNEEIRLIRATMVSSAASDDDSESELWN